MRQKLILLLLFLLAGIVVEAQRLEKIWETEPLLKIPESVCMDVQRNVLYVSNIGSKSFGPGEGSIGKISPDGSIISVEWVKGLHAPKGIALTGDELFVAEPNALVIINVVSGEVVTEIPVPDAKMLNDVTAAPNGDVYVSDIRDGKILKFSHRVPSVIVEGLERPNGVLFSNGQLYFVDKGSLYVWEGDNKKLIADGMDESTDGIVQLGNGDFIVSCWSGIIYYIQSNGEKKTLLDTRDQKINTADIGWDAVQNILYVPTFWKNKVMAYSIDL